MNRTRETLHIRMSEEGKRILELLQEIHGINQTAVIEMILRREAREQGIPVSAYRKELQGAPKGPKEEDHRGQTAA